MADQPDGRDFADSFKRVVELLLSEDREEAQDAVRQLDTPLVANAGRMQVSASVQASVFLRDRFICRYCSRKTIFGPVLRLVSLMAPTAMRYHPHWKMTECHIAFWRESTSCDHVIPVARGGSSKPDNLITACYMCNSIKQNWLVEELRWNVLPVWDTDWDGLIRYYPELTRTAPGGNALPFRTWERALERAGAQLPPAHDNR